ncbi:MarR family transcriptional regulator [Glycocaulis alkaliphilus]|uniref:MarR family transcriptional regulator n=1 Tax=Glycocaulis alkaliphilus TaxID=1434191 RepID=A0A3T0E9D5_9PROT|nr:MarR family transcriptional regulator [Glycocaulis alkaliphilus]AZU03806.1 MarR family transcriptional regulator [Glycocaulis alkaliphilus]GGB84062.1 MarR family transcriptional regulator [Glycocaulis alkaliphilus]
MKDHDEILIALRRIIRAVHLRSKKLEKETGLTAPQFIVLQALSRHGAMKPSALSREISLGQPTVTAILDRLKRAGLIERTASASDRRTCPAQITPAGLAVIETSPELLQTGFLKAFRKLPDWERHMLIGALQRVAELMDASDVDASPILTGCSEMVKPASDNNEPPKA